MFIHFPQTEPDTGDNLDNGCMAGDGLNEIKECAAVPRRRLIQVNEPEKLTWRVSGSVAVSVTIKHALQRRRAAK